LKRLVRQLGMKDIEEIALDSAYLARCDMLAKRGVESIPIKLKRNATAKSRGSQAWRRMILNYLNDRESFIEITLKRTIAYWLRSRKKTMQKKEGCTCIIAYNVVRAVVNPLRLMK
jgi:transposase